MEVHLEGDGGGYLALLPDSRLAIGILVNRTGCVGAVVNIAGSVQTIVNQLLDRT